jgi:CRISPR/Cas system CSM-associated protein Csm5 (group 7 of RAMP superfamily)
MYLFGKTEEKLTMFKNKAPYHKDNDYFNFLKPNFSIVTLISSLYKCSIFYSTFWLVAE